MSKEFKRIQESVIKVSLHITHWNPIKRDDRIRDNASAHFKADKRVAKTNQKVLISTHLDDYIRIEQQTRNHMKERTVPFETPWYLLPSKEVASGEFQKEIQRDFDLLDESKEKFFADYDSAIERAKNETHGQLFNPNNYPSLNEIKTRFNAELNYEPLADSGHFLADFGKYNGDIKKQFESSMQRRIRDATESLFQRIIEPLAYAETKLSDGSTFRDSMIKNVLETLDSVEKLNFTEDKNLAQIISNARTVLSRNNIDTIRNDEDVRKKTAKEAEQIIDKMAAYFTPK